MAVRVKFVMDHGSIGAMLRGGLGEAEVAAATERVAAAARAAGIMVDGIPGDIPLPIETSMTITDRAHGSVTIAHPSGEAVQAKDGVLTRAVG